MIKAGHDWEKEIDRSLEAAHIFVALLTVDFTSSDYIYGKGSPLDNLAGANVTDLRGFVLLRKRCCTGTPNPPAVDRDLHGSQVA